MKSGSEFSKILLTVIIVALLSFAGYFIYLLTDKKYDDYRVRTARILLKQFDKSMQKADFERCLKLLDSAYNIYSDLPDYQNSFEKGIILNNKGSVYLTMALYFTEDSIIKLNYFNYASDYFDSAIKVYENWLTVFTNINNKDLMEMLTKNYTENIPGIKKNRLKKMISRRTKEIHQARIETPRRISVCWSNKGIIMRHTNKPESAIRYYKKAIELWPDNLTAKNNLNTMLGLPPEKIPFLKRIFPPERF